MMIDLASQSHFLAGAIMGFAIGGVILIERESAIGFSKLFL